MAYLELQVQEILPHNINRPLLHIGINQDPLALPNISLQSNKNINQPLRLPQQRRSLENLLLQTWFHNRRKKPPVLMGVDNIIADKRSNNRVRNLLLTPSFRI